MCIRDRTQSTWGDMVFVYKKGKSMISSIRRQQNDKIRTVSRVKLTQQTIVQRLHEHLSPFVAGIRSQCKLIVTTNCLFYKPFSKRRFPSRLKNTVELLTSSPETDQPNLRSLTNDHFTQKTIDQLVVFLYRLGQFAKIRGLSPPFVTPETLLTEFKLDQSRLYHIEDSSQVLYYPLATSDDVRSLEQIRKTTLQTHSNTLNQITNENLEQIEVFINKLYEGEPQKDTGNEYFDTPMSFRPETRSNLRQRTVDLASRLFLRTEKLHKMITLFLCEGPINQSPQLFFELPPGRRSVSFEISEITAGDYYFIAHLPDRNRYLGNIKPKTKVTLSYRREMNEREINRVCELLGQVNSLSGLSLDISDVDRSDAIYVALASLFAPVSKYNYPLTSINLIELSITIRNKVIIAVSYTHLTLPTIYSV
eukprot:TRINITY_DN7095_c0_g1_i2.p1 TRINITY_DN7095_c0_g1~~TRINITY_DN7095_c0_g1_i2.p1  ORF type:complete len:435 (-),score=51.76 TRINITY_DN7095_c0_g1_i2:33-1298(-)